MHPEYLRFFNVGKCHSSFKHYVYHNCTFHMSLRLQFLSFLNTHARFCASNKNCVLQLNDI